MTSPHEQLEIGQVIYCIASDTGAVYPVQVTEEVVHKSISGTKKSYTVRLDVFDEEGQVESSLVALDGLGDQWFPSLEMAREFLTGHYAEVVNDLIARAEKLSTISFSATVQPVPVATQGQEEQQQLPTKPVVKAPVPATVTKKKKPTVTLLDGTVVDLTIEEDGNKQQ